MMRARPAAPFLFCVAVTASACQLVWSYDGLMDAGGTTAAGSGGNRTTSSAASHVSSSSSSGVAGSSASGSSSSGSEPGCVDAGDAGDALDAEVDALGMACENPCDVAAVMAHPTIENEVYACTLSAGGAPNPSCIAQHEGLSMPCADCWAQLGSCGATKCVGDCFTGDVYASGCNDCLAMMCDCAFTACSGTVRPAAVDAGVDAPCD